MPKPRCLPTPILYKQVGQMRKLMGLWNKGTKKNEANILAKKNPHPFMREGRPDFLNNNLGVNQAHITRRQVVMNRHFTEIVSDVLANNLKTALTDIGVTITSIETKAWNKGVNIFYSRTKNFDESIHEDLNSLISQLKSSISERQLIGRTPQVNFVYDKSVEAERKLDLALSTAKVNLKSEPDVSLEKISSKSIQPSQNMTKRVYSDFKAKQFYAPLDMSNLTGGLDYINLYKEVVQKLERGRGESLRMSPKDGVMPHKPLFRDTTVVDRKNEEEDSMTRIIQMQRFIVNQRKKNEFLSKLRRKQELLDRDKIKWDLPEVTEEI